MNQLNKHSRTSRPLDKRRRVALLVETTKSLGRGVLSGISRFVRTRASWSTIVDERNLHDPVPRWLNQSRGDGIICRGTDRTIIDFATSSGVPIVKLGGEFDDQIPTVVANEELISRRAAEHLLACRLSQFAFAGVKGKRWSELRRAAFTQILSEAGFECQCYDLDQAGGRQRSWDRDQQSLGKWIESLPTPTGVFVAYDVLGLQALNACHAIGRLVPDEIVLMGVDNDEALCQLANPPLTSVAQDFEGIGFAAAQLLDDLMCGRAPVETMQVIHPLDVIVRQSTDLIAAPDQDVTMALRFIRENACRGLKVNEVANCLNLSRRTLERRFAQCIQRSPKEEIIRVQINRVKELLVASDYTLEQIAGLTGFNHVSHMCVLFKKRIGVSPGKHRSRNEP